MIANNLLEYYFKYNTENELNKLFEKSKDDSMEFMILMTAFYGLRRSEVLSLKWDAFDFENNTINLIEFEESLE